MSILSRSSSKLCPNKSGDDHKKPVIVGISVLISLLLFPLISVFPQRISLVTPINSVQSEKVSETISSSLSKHFTIINQSLTETIFEVQGFERPFNLSTEESKDFGTRVGSNYFLLVRTDTLRRTSFEKNKYFESYATFYLVSSRTGRLVYWKLTKFETPSPELAQKELFDSLEQTASLIRNQIDTAEESETAESIPDVASNSEIAESRPPMPYRRMKPKYTDIAALYDVLATVDIEVSVNAEGQITGTEILRWAGFGLDESVTETVRKMKWRPADRDGKPLAMRVLLRYNFRNIDNDR